MHQFVCEDDLGEINAIAELACGVLTPWRVDASGRKWFRRELPPLKNAIIRGVPSDSISIGSKPMDNPNGAGVEQLEIEVFESDEE